MFCLLWNFTWLFTGVVKRWWLDFHFRVNWCFKECSKLVTPFWTLNSAVRIKCISKERFPVKGFSVSPRERRFKKLFMLHLSVFSFLQLQRRHLRRRRELVSLRVRLWIRRTGLPHQWVPGNRRGRVEGSGGRGVRGERPRRGSVSRLFQGDRLGSLLGRRS